MKRVWVRVSHWGEDYLFEVDREEARAIASRAKKADGSSGRSKPVSPVLYDTATLRAMAWEKGGFWHVVGSRKEE